MDKQNNPPNPAAADAVLKQASVRSRRAFLTLGAGAAAAYGGWWWLRSRPQEGGVEWPIRRVLSGNEKLAEAYFSDGHRSPEFASSVAGTDTRLNGDIGLGNDFEADTWNLSVERLNASSPIEVTMQQIRSLPRVEQTTQLNCIEGWTVMVHWAGVRFADFTAQFAPESRSAKYVRMQTPDEEYYVGLDSASAFHPQTLLCYEMDGAPLTSAHGAPLRLVIPVKYGVKNIKRIGTITYTDERPEDYWANQGYDWFAGL
ncbi:MAG: molybdopterin-dependent oxidoreductase [Acidobacteriota bacterium]